MMWEGLLLLPAFALAIALLRAVANRSRIRTTALYFGVATVPLIGYGAVLLLLIAGWWTVARRIPDASYGLLPWLTIGWVIGAMLLYGFTRFES
jgi:hypothetical protein